MRYDPFQTLEESWGLRVAPRERAILRLATTRVARHDRNAWNQLKWEILDYADWGRDFYPAQEPFENAASLVIRSLSRAEKEALYALWRNSSHSRANDDDNRIQDAFSRFIVMKVIERAGTAAYRT